MKTRVARAFHWVAEPRVQRVAYFVIYLFHIVAGLGILYTDPNSIIRVLGYWPMLAFSILLSGGGLFGAISVLPGWNFIERVAIGGLMVGIALASILIIGGPQGGSAISMWALITGWFIVFAYRFWEIRLYSVAPDARG